jgi:phosphatidylserine decarboxylase
MERKWSVRGRCKRIVTIWTSLRESQDFKTSRQEIKPQEGRPTSTQETPLKLSYITLLLLSLIAFQASSAVARPLEEVKAESTKLPPQAPQFLKGLPAPGASYAPQRAITKKLQSMIEDKSYQDDFQEAIDAVSSQGISELEQIKTLDQFYFYVDAMSRWIPQIRVWDLDGDMVHERTVYLRIVQLYYYFNQPSLKALQSPIAPLEGEKLTPVSSWLREFAVDWGSFLDTKESSEYLESFKYAPEYTWQDYEKMPEDYQTFNEYFARTFKDADQQRPVASADDDRVIVFPAESTYVGQWAIGTSVGEPIPSLASIVVKHIPWSIQELLQDSKYADTFAGGLFCHSFLNTFDYHRMHTPVAGRVIEAKFIPGQVYLNVGLAEQEGEVAHGELANAVIPKRYLDASDRTGYQFVQCRGLLVLESPVGKVAVLPMGMAQVSSVVFVTPESEGQNPIVLTKSEQKGLSYEQQVDLLNKKLQDNLVGKEFKKGEMFSYFQFGGSDCVVVFERKANVDITARPGVHYNIRSQYGRSNINN